MEIADLKQLKNQFRKVVQDYREVIEDGYYKPHGAEGDREKPKKKIIRLFKKSPAAVKSELLLIVHKTLSERSGPRDDRSSLYDSFESAGRLTSWLRNLAIELVNELDELKKG